LLFAVGEALSLQISLFHHGRYREDTLKSLCLAPPFCSISVQHRQCGRDGWITIPLMKNIGYRRRCQRCEACASTGALSLPPVMEPSLLSWPNFSNPVLSGVIAAVIPALLLLWHPSHSGRLEAARTGMKGFLLTNFRRSRKFFAGMAFSPAPEPLACHVAGVFCSPPSRHCIEPSADLVPFL